MKIAPGKKAKELLRAAREMQRELDEIAALPNVRSVARHDPNQLVTRATPAAEWRPGGRRLRHG